MEGNLDGVRLQVENPGDLLGAEIGAEAQREELAVALVKLRDSVAEIETLERRLLMTLFCTLGHLGRQRRTAKHVVGDAAPRDPDQPGGRLAAPRVVAVAIAKRALEGLVRNVLRVGPVTDAIGDVAVDTADERLWVGQRVHLVTG